MPSEKEKLQLISRIVLDINEVKDVDILLERILTRVREFFDADAGSVYIKEGDHLVFSHAQNDTLRERLEPGKKLIFKSYTIPIDDRSISGYVARHNEIVNIENAYSIDESLPFSFDSRFDRLSGYRTVSVLALPMATHRGDVAGVMQVINAREPGGRVSPFPRSDEPLISHFARHAALALERARMTRDIVLRMIAMAGLHDPLETGAHVNRVGAYSVEIYEEWARRKGLPWDEVECWKDLLRIAAMLHDVGKVAISDLILKKPGRLNAVEYEIMKSHTTLGARLFENKESDFDRLAEQVALNHHERWDGTGYPGHAAFTGEGPPDGAGNAREPARSKSGEEIPLFARIVAVADVYDALGSRRSYKEPWEESRVLEEMQRGSGTRFDPEVIEAFFGCLDALKAVAERYPDPEGALPGGA